MPLDSPMDYNAKLFCHTHWKGDQSRSCWPSLLPHLAEGTPEEVLSRGLLWDLNIVAFDRDRKIQCSAHEESGKARQNSLLESKF